VEKVMNVGKQIKKVLREKPEMNQENLAKLSGVSKDRISRIVNQRALPSMAELKKIADALRVKPDFLVSDSDEVVFQFTENDKRFLELLKEPDLAISLRALSKLSIEDRKAINKVIQRFSQITEDKRTIGKMVQHLAEATK
jgi:transcriptional regulator with XRE-family HTH domain